MSTNHISLNIYEIMSQISLHDARIYTLQIGTTSITIHLKNNIYLVCKQKQFNKASISIDFDDLEIYFVKHAYRKFTQRYLTTLISQPLSALEKLFKKHFEIELIDVFYTDQFGLNLYGTILQSTGYLRQDILIRIFVTKKDVTLFFDE